MEIRIVRLLATLGFFTAVTLLMVTFAGTWGYVGGSMLFGSMSWALWRAEADARANQQVHDRVAAQRAVTGEPGGPPWS